MAKIPVVTLRFASPDQLQNVLDRVDKGVDLDKIKEVLADAELKKISATINGVQIDWRRDWREEREETAKAFRSIRCGLGPFLTKDDLAVLARWDELNQKLKSAFPPGPERRENRQPASAVDPEARKKLQRLGVSKDLANDLLVAVGLKRVGYSSIITKRGEAQCLTVFLSCCAQGSASPSIIGGS